MYDYQAAVEKVTDGDTVRFLFDHGMFIRSSHAIRLSGVNAPELNEPGGTDARAWVSAWLVHHGLHGSMPWPFRVATEKDKQTFNRYIGVIRCATCTESLNDAANAYLGGTP